jgi:hypothetical protein
MQPDTNVHFKALKKKFLRGNDEDETTALSELNLIKMDPDENWATIKEPIKDKKKKEL